MWWSLWWVWIAGALGLAILEVLVPGFMFVGFAIGAAAVGLLLALGVSMSLPWILVVFAVLSLLSWIGMRRMFGVRKGQKKIWTRDINEE